MFTWDTVIVQPTNPNARDEILHLSLYGLSTYLSGRDDIGSLRNLYTQFKFVSYTQTHIPSIRRPAGNAIMGNEMGAIGGGYFSPVDDMIYFAKPMLPHLEPDALDRDNIQDVRNFFKKSIYSKFTLRIPLKTVINRTFADPTGGVPVLDQVPSSAKWMDMDDDTEVFGYSRVNHGWVYASYPRYQNPLQPTGSPDVTLPIQSWTVQHRAVVLFRDNH